MYEPVSVATIARVIRDMRMRGTVVGIPGRGVFVPE
jgi:DNA-binding transcriptional regulator YhcF (GntR family)